MVKIGRQKNRPNTFVSPAPVGWRTLAEKVYYGERSHDEGDISTPFLRLSVDVFLFKYLTHCFFYVTLRHHVDVNTSSAVPYMANRAMVYCQYRIIYRVEVDVTCEFTAVAIKPLSEIGVQLHKMLY